MKKQAKEMNVVTEEEATSSPNCSESAWTLYLQQPSSSSPSHHHHTPQIIPCSCDHALPEDRFCHHHDHQSDEEEEDLSMVSDASSGPPHFDHDLDDDDDQILDQPVIEFEDPSLKKRKLQSLHHDLALDFDDTASSMYFPSPKHMKKESVNNVENVGDCSSLQSFIFYSSQHYTASHFQAISAVNFQDFYGFTDQSLYSTKQISAKPVI